MMISNFSHAVENSHKNISQAESRAGSYKAHVYNSLVAQKKGSSPKAAATGTSQQSGSAFRKFGGTMAMRAGGTSNSLLM